MHQRSIYVGLGFLFSFVIFHVSRSAYHGGTRDFQLASRLFQLHEGQSNSSNNGRDEGAGHAIGPTHHSLSGTADNLYDVQNETLGVQEVFVLSMPDRRDKRDAFAMQAALSGITFQLAEGVNGETLPEKSLPHTMALDKKQLGCWRAHLNIFESMVERKVETALVFEDDADWDVALKQQLVQFARGSRFLSNTPNDTVPLSPYGDGWDILWLGHCATTPDPDDNRRWVIPNDPTVVPPHKRSEFDRPDMSTWENGEHGDKSTRIVHKSSFNVCTAAYIISLKGAQKVLYHLSMLPFNEPIDIGMAFMCRFKKSNFNCITPFPSIVGVSKPAGDSSRWSDLGHAPEQAYVEETGYSERVSFSTRQNIDRLLLGEDKYASQFPDDYPEMSLAEIGRGVGHAEWLGVPWQGEHHVEEQPTVDEQPDVEGGTWGELIESDQLPTQGDDPQQVPESHEKPDELSS